MGGFGSGRTAWRAKCEHFLAIDARRWARGGYLQGGYFGWQWTYNGERTSSISVWPQDRAVELSYTKDGESYRYRVYLTSTSCHFGGTRIWFQCPSFRCGRRVAKLYLGNRYFACRRCYNLAYQSQSYTAYDRALVQAGKVRRRLGGYEGTANPFPDKPKRMRWRTYERLRERCEQYEEIGDGRLWLFMAKWLEK